VKKPDYNVFPTGVYPCEWDDLLVEGSTYATVYTKMNGEADGLPVGFTFCDDDGCWDIVIDKDEITYEDVEEALKKLSEKTGKTYLFKRPDD
jgi:hypothetical protein